MVSSTPQPHFTPGKDPVPIVQEAGWAPGPAWKDGISRSHRDSIPDRPAGSSVAIPTELPGPHIDNTIRYNFNNVTPARRFPSCILVAYQFNFTQKWCFKIMWFVVCGLWIKKLIKMNCFFLPHCMWFIFKCQFIVVIVLKFCGLNVIPRPP